MWVVILETLGVHIGKVSFCNYASFQTTGVLLVPEGFDSTEKLKYPNNMRH